MCYCVKPCYCSYDCVHSQYTFINSYLVKNAFLYVISVASSMKEPWEEKVKRVRATSPYSHLPNWSIPHTLTTPLSLSFTHCSICSSPMFPPGLKGGGGGGGGRGIEHLEAIYALARSYTAILCCVNTVKRGVLHPFTALTH